MNAKTRRSDQARRAKMRSPGRPPVLHRSERRPFWRAIAEGCSSEDAALKAGVSQPVGTRWFRECGGMPPSHLAVSAPLPTGRYLSLTEREQIALLRVRGEGVREIARQLERAASTISRELRRNATTRSGGFEYRAVTAQWHADRASRRPKPAKLAINAALRTYVQDRLAGESCQRSRQEAFRPYGKVEWTTPRATAASKVGARMEPGTNSASPRD
jgi:DNA-binding CsgD family transcriptional regulator